MFPVSLQWPVAPARKRSLCGKRSHSIAALVHYLQCILFGEQFITQVVVTGTAKCAVKTGVLKIHILVGIIMGRMPQVKHLQVYN